MKFMVICIHVCMEVMGKKPATLPGYVCSAAGAVQEHSLLEMTEGGIIYDIPSDPVTAKKFDPETGGNIAYGVLLGVPTTPNPAYGQVQR